MVNKTFGIRYEDKYALERRTPVIPSHLERLSREHGLKAVVQPSPKRIFSDNEYISRGAMISDDLSSCPVIFGVKEMPESFFEPGKTYIFFSHVIKGQPHNMPMLRRMMELGCNLIDYEKVVDELGRRLIFFGKFAGLAGMINTLWALGLRLKHMRMDTPFQRIRQARTYDSLDEARKDLSLAGMEIARYGLPKVLKPFVIGYTGYGNVAMGAHEISNYLPVKEILPEELPSLHLKSDLPDNVIYKVVFMEKHLSEPLHPDVPFDLQHYYSEPGQYKSQFEQYLPHLSVLMNCMYWDERYPRIVTRSYLKDLYAKGEPKLKAIGDITCDVDGSVESTVKAASIEEPIYVYNPFEHAATTGHEGNGLLMMTVDILPSELPRESSEYFSQVLMNYIRPIVEADYGMSFDDLNLPSSIKKALILHEGKLAPDYQYIHQYL